MKISIITGTLNETPNVVVESEVSTPEQVAKAYLKVIEVLSKNASIPLPDNWDGIRETVKERDIICQDCGNKEWLGVHHKDLNRLNNELDNLVLLCWNCHMNKHHNKVNGI